MRRRLFPSLYKRRRHVVRYLRNSSRNVRVGTLTIKAGVPMRGLDTFLFGLRVRNIVGLVGNKVCELLWEECSLGRGFSTYFLPLQRFVHGVITCFTALFGRGQSLRCPVFIILVMDCWRWTCYGCGRGWSLSGSQFKFVRSLS